MTVRPAVLSVFAELAFVSIVPPGWAESVEKESL